MTTKTTKIKNLIFSPLSLQYLLGLLATGSDTPALNAITAAWHLENTTLEQINTYLGQNITNDNNISNGNAMLYLANAAFISRQATITPNLQAQIQNEYNATIYHAPRRR